MEEKMINLKVVTKPEEGRPFLDYRKRGKRNQYCKRRKSLYLYNAYGEIKGYRCDESMCKRGKDI